MKIANDFSLLLMDILWNWQNQQSLQEAIPTIQGTINYEFVVIFLLTNYFTGLI